MQPNTWNDKLMCCFISAAVLGDRHMGIYLPPNNCTDMRGAIDFGQFIMRDVNRITVFEGGVPDIDYRNMDGKWESRLFNRKSADAA